MRCVTTTHAGTRAGGGQGARRRTSVATVFISKSSKSGEGNDTSRRGSGCPPCVSSVRNQTERMGAEGARTIARKRDEYRVRDLPKLISGRILANQRPLSVHERVHLAREPPRHA